MSELFESDVEAVATELPLPLPGAVLRATREASGYSLTEVSQALKFGVRQIEALENDDYSTLTGTTFIRGFVRSYARYLRLDEAPLLAALEPQAPVAVAEMRPMESMDEAMPAATTGGNKRAYGLAVIVLLLCGGAWFAWQEQPASTSSPEVATPAPATVPLEPVQAPASTIVDSPAKHTENASATATVVAPSPAVITPVTTAETPAPLAETVPAAPAPNPNERQLVFSFSDVSWVEVRDASQRVLYSGRSTPDTRQVVRGRPPFQLVVGNAQAVKLRYEDRSIDLQPYTRVDVARLTLDDNTK
jgi:cytoskeleton protein RodZ